MTQFLSIESPIQWTKVHWMPINFQIKFFKNVKHLVHVCIPVWGIITKRRDIGCCSLESFLLNSQQDSFSVVYPASYLRPGLFWLPVAHTVLVIKYLELNTLSDSQNMAVHQIIQWDQKEWRWRDYEFEESCLTRLEHSLKMQ